MPVSQFPFSRHLPSNPQAQCPTLSSVVELRALAPRPLVVPPAGSAGACGLPLPCGERRGAVCKLRFCVATAIHIPRQPRAHRAFGFRWNFSPRAPQSHTTRSLGHHPPRLSPTGRSSAPAPAVLDGAWQGRAELGLAPAGCQWENNSALAAVKWRLRLLSAILVLKSVCQSQHIGQNSQRISSILVETVSTYSLSRHGYRSPYLKYDG